MNVMNERTQRLRDAGYKLTHARLTVLQVLETQSGHLTSTDILEAVMQADASIGRASVFRTLDLLTQLAIIRPTYIASAAAPVYVLMPEGHHHHIICVRCHQVIDFEDCGLHQLTRQLEGLYKMRLTGHLLEFYGICESCQHVAQAAND